MSLPPRAPGRTRPAGPTGTPPAIAVLARGAILAAIGPAALLLAGGLAAASGVAPTIGIGPGDDVVPLPSTWEFRMGDEVSDGALRPEHEVGGFHDDEWGPVTVPGNWAHDDVSLDRGFEREGVGWYRTLVEVAPERTAAPLALTLGRVGDAATVYFNGEVVGTQGSLEPRYRTSSFRAYTHVVPARLIRTDVPNVLVVRVESRGVLFSGIYAGEPAIGSPAAIAASVERGTYLRDGAHLALLAMAMTVVLFHLMIFKRRPQQREQLYLALGIVAFTPALLMPTELRTYLWADDGVGFVVLTASLAVSTALLARFYEHLFDVRVTAASWGVMILAFAYAAVALALSGTDQLMVVMGSAFAPVIVTLVYVYYLFAVAIRRRICDAALLAVGQTIAAIFAFHTDFTMSGLLESDTFCLPYTFPVFLYFVAAVLARRSAILHREVEELNETLELKVAERTRDLDGANQELAGLNAALESKVERQVNQIQGMQRLKRFLAPQVVEAMVGDEGISLAVKRKELTVFYADVSNFDDLIEGMEAEEVIDVYNAYHQRVADLIFEYGGTLDRFFGTRVTGFLGDPLPVERKEEKAVRMAMALRDAVRELRASWPPAPLPIDLRVGINTGYVTVGPIGCEHRVEYTAVGRAATVAAMLQGQADPGQILIGARTLEAVEDLVEGEALQISLRGGARTTAIFDVHRLRDSAAPTPPSSGPWGTTNVLGAPSIRQGKYLGPYRVLEQIGEGGMGTVYRALDEGLEREVAIKVLSRELSRDPGFLERFRKEARALASLDSEHIVRIYFISERDAVPFFAMEHVGGGSLRDRLRREGRLGHGEARRVALETARGLAAAWSCGIVHRDVKPDNLLLTDTGKVKITDFGLTKRMEGDSGLTRAGVAMGTPLYMAPEQGRGESVDCRADQYALGLTLFHCLVGRPPFDAETFTGLLRMHEEAPLPSRDECEIECPDELWEIVVRMAAKDPGQRFPHYDELIARLVGQTQDRTLAVPTPAPGPGADARATG